MFKKRASEEKSAMLIQKVRKRKKEREKDYPSAAEKILILTLPYVYLS